MFNFINKDHFVRHFPSGKDPCILTVGYDDFRTVKPLFAFRVQNFYTWHFVLSGSGTLELGDKTFEISTGQIFFIPPGIKMRYYPKSDAPWEYVWFTLNPETARQYGKLLGLSEETPVTESRYIQKIRLCLKRMFESFEDGGGYFSVLSCFYEIMEICTSYSPRTGIRRIREHIDETFALPSFNIGQLCCDVGISHPQLLRLFKSTYGMTVKKYVLKKRMELACELLLNTDLSIKSVAYSCGFSDEIHFMKTFKKELGTSALHYRKSHY